MIWKTNFVDAQNTSDTKENISNLEAAIEPKDILSDKTLSRVVDARKSMVFGNKDDEVSV